MPDKNTEVERLFGDNFLDGDTPEEDGGATQFSVVGALDVAEFFYIAGLKRAIELMPKEIECDDLDRDDAYFRGNNSCIESATQAITNEIKEREG